MRQALLFDKRAALPLDRPRPRKLRPRIFDRHAWRLALVAFDPSLLDVRVLEKHLKPAK
ncbi:MAG TPA: hypothetical protein VD906_07025 [Caulobacteraceae bacterium]|nr:hypothetical protein [Caulobacteraceae bacterium]